MNSHPPLTQTSLRLCSILEIFGLFCFVFLLNPDYKASCENKRMGTFYSQKVLIPFIHLVTILRAEEEL